MAAPLASRTLPRLLLAAIVALSLWAHLWGVRGDLPWTYASDEGQSAVLAIRMAAEGDPNPRWFGHPGSTYFYPLAALFRVGNAVEAGQSPLRHDPGLAARVGGDPGRYFVLGRLLSVLYAVAALPLLYLIARRAHDTMTALVATWLAMLSPLTLEHAQMMRTDSAGLFFGLLALWLSLRVLDHPGRKPHALAGLALGAAIGTRYFLVTLVPTLLLADAILWRRLGADPERRRRLLRASLLGLACVALGFVVTTPYFLLDLPTVWQNLVHETRGEHLGADGLGFFGNLRWYATNALPASLPDVALVLAAFGLGHAIWRRNVRALLAAASIVTFVVAISTASLHWQRWLIQVLPLVAMLAAAGLVVLARALARLFSTRRSAAVALVVLATALLTAGPARGYLLFAVAQGRPGTRVIAREWMIANLPPGSTIAADLYTAPLDDSQLLADYHFSLARDGTIEDYRQAGYRYLMISDAIYGRFLREPRRYVREVAFYETLLRTAKPVARFAPREGGRGPVITIIEIAPAP